MQRNDNDNLECYYENFTPADSIFITLLHHITTIDFNGKYIVNITFTELSKFTINQLDIFKKYKHYLQAVEHYQISQAKMKEQLNQGRK